MDKIRLCPISKPQPPCKTGTIEKQKIYKDGSTSNCCYKNTNKRKSKNNLEMYHNNHNPEPNNFFHNKNKSRKCSSKKPKPPCSEGYEEKVKTYKDGSVSKCCYKLKRSKKIILQMNADNMPNKNISRKCPSTKPIPPCKQGFYKKIKIYKDGTFSECCYKGNSKNTPEIHVPLNTNLLHNHNTTIENNIPNLTKNLCALDNKSGICEKVTSGKGDNDCYYDTNELRCKYTDSYISTKTKDMIVVLQATEDWNKAFNSNGDKGLFSVLKSFSDFDFIYKKVSNLNDIKKLFKKFNDNAKIAHLIIMAHGSISSMVLSNKYSITINNMDEFVKIIKPKLSTNASILLHSCCVGTGGLEANNFANNLAYKLPDHVIFGSEKAIKRGDLIVSFALTDIHRRSIDMWYEIDPASGYQINPFIHSL